MDSDCRSWSDRHSYAVGDAFTNALMGIPPNGKKMPIWMANLWRFAGGKIMEW